MNIVEVKSFEIEKCVDEASTSEEKKALIHKYIQSIEKDQSSHCIDGTSELFSGMKYVNHNADVHLDHFSGRLVLLDFFTYCCINCIHIMPALHRLESEIPVSEGLLIVGVHSAKFNNEKVEENIRKAIERYEISHPVINDSKINVWNELCVKCWPTLILISPTGKVLFSLAGESHMGLVTLFIESAKSYYEQSGQMTNYELILDPLESWEETDGPSDDLRLKFPGKLAVDDSGERIVISDSGHHRIVIADIGGKVSEVIGGPKSGFVDGDFQSARFNSPQGVCWHGQNTIFVADCNNHAIRKVGLLVKKVITVCGTGVQGNDLEGGKNGLDQPISSPWDVVVGGSPRVPDGRKLLYIAMSGCHQIWTLALDNTDFQKGAEIEMGTCVRYAGSGKEENRNNAYPHKAGFAQPSGLTHSAAANALYIADSESSTIRKMLLHNGTVQALVGGDIDPMNLFAYGDVDGTGRNAKLQHPIGVQWDSVKQVLYVADTYNHKIKIVDPKKKSCVTLEGMNDGNGNSYFCEPSGLSIDPLCKRLYVADTNNHEIKVVSLDDASVTKFSLRLAAKSESTATDRVELLTGDKTPPTVLGLVRCSESQSVSIFLSYGDLHLNWDAPSSWQVSYRCSDSDQYYLVSNGSFGKDSETEITFPVTDITKRSQYIESVILCVESILYYCETEGDVCKMLRYKAVVPVAIKSKCDSESVKLSIRIA